jgi:hypothetical protein
MADAKRAIEPEEHMPAFEAKFMLQCCAASHFTPPAAAIVAAPRGSVGHFAVESAGARIAQVRDPAPSPL